MITVLVLEDEEYTRKYLVKLVEQHPEVDMVWGAAGGDEAVEIAASHQPTLALLDVELGRGERNTGIQVAEEIAEQSPNTRYIFITGYAKYALDSFVVHPYDYLLKPVDRTHLQEALQGVANLVNNNQIQEKNDVLTIKSKGGADIVPIREIMFIETGNRQTTIHTPNNSYTTYQPLHYFTKLLPQEVFLRLHKSFIVNIRYISSFHEIGNRTFQIKFRDSNKTALMSRQHYLSNRELLGL